MTKYKDRYQVIMFSPPRSFYNCEVIYWLRDKDYAKVALFGRQVLVIKRDIRNTVIGTRVSKVTRHAFNQ